MYKKSSKVSKQVKALFLVLLLIPSYGSALWEIPTAVAFGWWLKTPMGQKASSMIFVSCKQKIKDAMAKKALGSSNLDRAKALSASISGYIQKIKGIKPSDKKPELQESTAAPIDISELKKEGLGSVLSVLQPAAMRSFFEKLGSSAYSGKDNDQEAFSYYKKDESAQSCEFTKVDATVKNQSASGMFPRITNNYYSGSSGDTNAEFGKKRFFQGAFAGSLVTSWMCGKQGQKAKA